MILAMHRYTGTTRESALQSRTTSRLCCAATAAAVGLLLGGCGAPTAPVQPPATTSVAPASPSASGTAPTPAVLDWTNSLCSGLQPVVSRLTAPPAPNLADVTGTRQAYIDYLATAQPLADQALQQLDVVGPPPVPNGNQIDAQIREQLTQMRTDISQARSQLQQADPSNPISIGSAIASTASVFASLGNSAQALTKIKDDPQLGPAFAQAPSCEPFRTVG